MKGIFALKISIDIAMTVLIPVMMAYHLTGNLAHEILGVLLFVLFFAHHILNRHWYGNLLNGRGGIPGMLHAVSNLLLFLAMIAMAATSVLVSRDVFSFLSLDSGGDIRTLHVCACTWGFVLMGIHLGFHLNMVAIPLGKAMGRAQRNVKKAVLRTIAAAVSAYGVYASFAQAIGSKLVMYYSFSYVDPERNPLSFLIELLAILGMYACAAHYSVKACGALAAGRN